MNKDFHLEDLIRRHVGCVVEVFKFLISDWKTDPDCFYTDTDKEAVFLISDPLHWIRFAVDTDPVYQMGTSLNKDEMSLIC